MKKVVKIAISRGYEPFKTLHMEYCNQVIFFDDRIVVEPGSGGSAYRYYGQMILDPLFWQALFGQGETEVFGQLTGQPILTTYWKHMAMMYMDYYFTAPIGADAYLELVVSDHIKAEKKIKKRMYENRPNKTNIR